MASLTVVVALLVGAPASPAQSAHAPSARAWLTTGDRASYYVLGHVTRFIRPGASRVDSTVAGNAWNVAFRNPDGSLVLVVVNDDWGTTPQRFNVSAPGQSFSYELPAGAVATFVLA